ncbi:site-specific integrase [Chitinophaga sedimenti]|uniref:tyrosine-type recombinase/integrase n=1 Tax=Chitinophaga sedimenti TaxID=2033606 RepID=UPI002002E431|nr:site-specific integrase [Chitinophaga sedimenti]MCK7560219.1 site-specific integrase [Chitinophaga sedimenti]
MHMDHSKFREYLLLKGYSTASIDTTVRVVGYLWRWAKTENIAALSETSYSDILAFVRWSSEGGASQKTVRGYLTHLRKYFDWLISEGEVADNPASCIQLQGIRRQLQHEILPVAHLQELYARYPVEIAYTAAKQMPPQDMNLLSRKRNKVITGLLVCQGLRVEEIAALQLRDLRLREGLIQVHAQRRTAERVLQLESWQVCGIMEYLHDVRTQILPADAQRDHVFVQPQGGNNFYGVTQIILKHLRRINGRVKILTSCVPA